MTFGHDLALQRVLIAELPQIAEMLACWLAQAGVEAGNVIVKVKTTSFELITRRMPLGWTPQSISYRVLPSS